MILTMQYQPTRPNTRQIWEYGTKLGFKQAKQQDYQQSEPARRGQEGAPADDTGRFVSRVLGSTEDTWTKVFRDQLNADPIPNILMNFLFACSTGAYLYALIRLYHPAREMALPPALMLGAFIVGVMLVYGMKWLAIRASGWAFGVSSLTTQYLFNVFLINKILAVVLVPFTVFLALDSACRPRPLEEEFVGVSISSSL